MVKSAFQICLMFLASIGGGSFIVLKVSKWCGDLLSQKILDNVQKKHEREILNYQSQLDTYSKELELLINQTAHVMSQQYDSEIEIYKEIWECIHSLMKNLNIALDNSLIDAHSPEEYKRRRSENIANLEKTISHTFDIVDANAPFYQENIYEQLLLVDEKCRKMYAILYEYKDSVDSYSEEDSESLVNILMPEVIGIKDKILESIREYLVSMKSQYITTKNRMVTK